jgi:glycosyltransferase involved in cell wall biosynthesis
MPSCCICLCVYNNEVGLPKVLQNIDAVKESNVFERIQILVFYDNSADASLDILKKYKTTGKCPIQIYENETQQMNASRVEKIAFARNGLLQMIRKEYSHYPYFAMMDSNHYSCVGKIRPAVLKRVLDHSSLWDSVSFDREDGYYDYWALSYDPYIYSFYHFTNWEDAVQKLRKDFNNRLKFYRETRPTGMFEVYSAFNGFALYKTSIFLECKYSADINMSLFPTDAILTHMKTVGQSILKYPKHDCEHRYLHLDAIRRGARIRISLLSLFEKTQQNQKEQMKRVASSLPLLGPFGRPTTIQH